MEVFIVFLAPSGAQGDTMFARPLLVYLELSIFIPLAQVSLSDYFVGNTEPKRLRPVIFNQQFYNSRWKTPLQNVKHLNWTLLIIFVT